MPGLLFLVLRTFAATIRSRRDLTLENLVLRHQLQVALRTNPHPRLQAPDRVFWVWLRCLWPDGWQQHLRLVQPETVLRWHRKGWRLYWTWKSRAQLGRPHLSAEVREIIARISHENPRWGRRAAKVRPVRLVLWG
jgi:putative transposase